MSSSIIPYVDDLCFTEKFTRAARSGRVDLNDWALRLENLGARFRSEADKPAPLRARSVDWRLLAADSFWILFELSLILAPTARVKEVFKHRSRRHLVTVEEVCRNVDES